MPIKKSKKKAKKKNGMFLELEGNIYLTSIKNGVETKELLDGKTILKAVAVVLEKALSYATKDLK